MTDVELDVWNNTLPITILAASRRRDIARPPMRLRRAADGDLTPRDAAGAVDEEVLEQVGRQGHVAVREVVVFPDRLLVRGLEGFQEGEGGGAR